MRKISGILFDMDGLLIDSEKVYHRVSYEMADALGVPLNDGILSKQMGRSPLESMQVFIRELGIVSHTAQELVDWRDRMMLESYRNRVDLMPGALEIMHMAAKHFKCAIATGSTKNLVDVVVKQLGIGDLFQLILPSDQIGKGKPDPEIYETAARQLGLDPKDCMVLEDSSNGCLAGHRAGCYVIAVPNIHTHNQDFSFVDFRAADLYEAWTHIVKVRNSP